MLWPGRSPHGKTERGHGGECAPREDRPAGNATVLADYADALALSRGRHL